MDDGNYLDKVTIYYRDEDDEHQKVTVSLSVALDKVRELLDDGGNLVTGVGLPHA